MKFKLISKLKTNFRAFSSIFGVRNIILILILIKFVKIFIYHGLPRSSWPYIKHLTSNQISNVTTNNQFNSVTLQFDFNFHYRI